MTDIWNPDGQQVLHWLPDEDRWEFIIWSDFLNFRGMGEKAAALPGVSGGIHYFLVCIHDDGAPANLIAHKYLVQPDGSLGPDLFSGFTKEERADYGRLMVQLKMTPEEQQRVRSLQEKAGKVHYPPNESIYALMRALPKRPVKGSLAEGFLKELHTGAA
jgi:hypothetical protein